MFKAIFIFCIKVYWFLIPPSKRRKCIFRESCSIYVYRHLQEGGFINGINAFKRRFYQCRPGYKVFYNSSNGALEVELSDLSIVGAQEFRTELLTHYNIHR
jgi:hypothetical protein